MHSRISRAPFIYEKERTEGHKPLESPNLLAPRYACSAMKLGDRNEPGNLARTSADTITFTPTVNPMPS